MNNYRDYCLAENLLLSPVLDEQAEASEAIARWLQLTNSELVWSAGKMKIIPFGDQVVTGNGVTWYPNVTPVADLTDDDFLAEEGTPPIQIKIKSQADSYNEVTLEILDRDHEYNTDVVRGVDQAAIEQFGSRPMDTIKAYEICNTAIASHAAQLLVQRKLYIRNEYQFSLGWQHVLLEPMDLVTVTEPGLNIDRRLVRLMSIEEDEDGKLTVVAEDALLGIGSAPNYPVQSKAGYGYRFGSGNQHCVIRYDRRRQRRGVLADHPRSTAYAKWLLQNDHHRFGDHGSGWRGEVYRR